MIKNLLSIALLATMYTASAQSFSAKYNFAATTPSTGITDPTPVPTATGLTFGTFSAVGTGTASSAPGRFSFTAWPTGATTTVDTYTSMTGALDPAIYYQVALTPTGGYHISLTGITFEARRSGTGIRSYSVRSSTDAYANNLTASTSTNTVLSVQGTNEFFWNFDATTSAQTGSSISLSGVNFTNFTNPISFRFYGWNSEASTGTFSIDSVVFMGTASLATSVGSVNVDLNSNFTMYPVPNHDGILYIESKNSLVPSKIEVLNVLGNCVLTTTDESADKVKLNLSEMPNGNYFVRITSAKGVTTKKLVIVK